jgi:hypothetical protein
MKDDLEFMEDKVKQEFEQFDNFMTKNKRRSFTVLLIGAGPVQPLAMDIAHKIFLNEKYRCTLININPRREFTEQY